MDNNMERFRTAIHESGHVVVGAYLGVQITGATLIQGRNSGRVNYDRDAANWDPASELVFVLAGWMAEHMVFADMEGKSDDHEKAKKLAQLVNQRNPDDAILQAQLKCETILLNQWAGLRAIARTLHQNGNLSGYQCRMVIHEAMSAPMTKPPVRSGRVPAVR